LVAPPRIERVAQATGAWSTARRHRMDRERESHDEHPRVGTTMERDKCPRKKMVAVRSREPRDRCRESWAK
jgi:hypothetical protein